MKAIFLVRYKCIFCLCVMMSLFHASVFARGEMYNIPIFGKPVATKEQCVNFLLSVNPMPGLTVSAQKLVEHYYEEAEKEGVRPDIAFAQALQETGFFRYGGLVREA